jgi:hypothetical protein
MKRLTLLALGLTFHIALAQTSQKDGCMLLPEVEAMIAARVFSGKEEDLIMANKALAEMRSDLKNILEHLFLKLSSIESLQGYFEGEDTEQHKFKFVDAVMNKCRNTPNLTLMLSLQSAVTDLLQQKSNEGGK